jgi:hypothetical protein
MKHECNKLDCKAAVLATELGRTLLRPYPSTRDGHEVCSLYRKCWFLFVCLWEATEKAWSKMTDFNVAHMKQPLARRSRRSGLYIQGAVWRRRTRRRRRRRRSRRSSMEEEEVEDEDDTTMNKLQCTLPTAT